MDPDLARSIISTAQSRGLNPRDLATAISYETAGTFDPWKAGPTTQWGQHRGLIQWGEPQRQEYGVTQGMPVADQMSAVGKYLDATGVKPGMGLMDIYSAINAGAVGRNNASDAGNGGAPGTVADKVNTQMAGHMANADRLLGTAGEQPGLLQAAQGEPATINPSGATPPTPEGAQGLLGAAQAPTDDYMKTIQGLLGQAQKAAPASTAPQAPKSLISPVEDTRIIPIKSSLSSRKRMLA